MPMGAGLSNGYLGTAVFLAQVGALTGAGKYCELARDSIRRIPLLLEALASDPESAQAVGSGLYGLGGISYGLSRLSQLLDDSEVASWLATSWSSPAGFLSPKTSRATPKAPPVAWCRCWRSATCRPPQSSRARYADELLLAVETGRTPAAGWSRSRDSPAATRESRGPWASTAYLETSTAKRLRVAVDLDRQSGSANAGWCSGDAGTALARLAAGVPADLDAYLKAATERPVLADMSLCHGELGAVEPLLWLTERDHPAIEAVRRRRAGLVLAAVQQYGPQCGTPRGVPSPGLLTGLAGIGYGLLRLGFGSRIPSVLLLEPSTGAQRPSQR